MKILDYGLRMTKRKLEEIKRERKMPMVVCAKIDCIDELKEKDPYVIVADGGNYRMVYHFSCCPPELLLETFEELKKKNHEYSTE